MPFVGSNFKLYNLFKKICTIALFQSGTKIIKTFMKLVVLSYFAGLGCEGYLEVITVMRFRQV